MYSTVADMHDSQSLLRRCMAAVASEISAGAPGDAINIPGWVSERSWDFASTPAWDDAWESAVAGGNSDPGDHEGVITDGMILSRSQQLLTQYPLPEGGV